MTSKELFDALTTFKYGSKEPLNETVSVLSYEVGRMLEQAMYMKWGQADAKEIQVRMGFFKSELIDAITQLHLICESIGVDYEEMKELGFEKAYERFIGKEKK